MPDAYIHVHRSDPCDPRTPFCGCHDDPWALCPRWREWGITEAEHEAAERLAACICGTPGTGNFDGPLRECPVHGEPTDSSL